MPDPGSVIRRVVAVADGPDQVGLGPDHPTLDGLPHVSVATQDGVIRAAEWLPGAVHRGVEKLFESRDYRQVLMLVDRHDWLSAFCSEIGVAVGVERALGLSPPARAQHLRILLCELTRIAHHLAFLAPMPGRIGEGWRSSAWAWREEVLGLVEWATGHRVHPMFCQVGGVRADVPDEWVEAVDHAAGGVGCAPDPCWPARLSALDGPELATLLDGSYAGVAVLARQDAVALGTSGPVARASGVDLDLRRDDPALPYPRFRVPVDAAGDARARMRILVEELAVSMDLVRWAAGQLRESAGQPVSVRLPKVVRVPEGSSYTWTENPTGINGYFLVSRNDPTPWRLKLRSAGFNNAAALGRALEGTREADLPAALASFLLVCGDVDK